MREGKIFPKTKLFLELVRFSHTLFALPFALGAMLIAAEGIPRVSVFIAILVCMATARNSAMAFNRLLDANFDAQNPRTQKRHLPAGLLTARQVALFIGANGVLFVISAATLNGLALLCALPVWAFLLSYSYWKRWSWACHLFLGIAIGLSPLGAWIAVRGEFALFPALLGAMLAFWITGFDIIYATQDEEADRALGLQSIPVRFGTHRALRIALASHVMMLLVAAGVGLLFSMSWPWWSAFAVSALLIVYIHYFRSSSDLDRMNQDFFLANVLISLMYLMGLAGHVIFTKGGVHVPWT